MAETDIKNRLKEAAKDSNIIIAAPDDIKKLLEDDYPIEITPFKPEREKIIELFEHRKKHALELVEKLPIHIAEARPGIQQLYNEIRECILFGVNGAAITLCGILVEFVLKYVGYHWDTPEGETDFNAAKWDKVVDGTQLAGAIKYAHDIGIVNDSEVDALTEFKNTIRNPYNHYNIKKLSKDVVFGKVKRVDLSTGEIKEMDIPAPENPIFFTQAKPWLDKQILSSVFITTYQNVVILLERLDEHREKIKSMNFG